MKTSQFRVPESSGVYSQKMTEDKNSDSKDSFSPKRNSDRLSDKAGSQNTFSPCPCQKGVNKGRACLGCPLAGRTIAVIGGLDRLEPVYRRMIGELGGSLVFHTGRMKTGGLPVRKTVGKADLVVFITSINSHGALATVKGECKRCGKPFCALKQSGARSLMKTLVDLTS